MTNDTTLITGAIADGSQAGYPQGSSAVYIQIFKTSEDTIPPIATAVTGTLRMKGRKGSTISIWSKEGPATGTLYQTLTLAYAEGDDPTTETAFEDYPFSFPIPLAKQEPYELGFIITAPRVDVIEDPPDPDEEAVVVSTNALLQISTITIDNLNPLIPQGGVVPGSSVLARSWANNGDASPPHVYFIGETAALVDLNDLTFLTANIRIDADIVGDPDEVKENDGMMEFLITRLQEDAAIGDLVINGTIRMRGYDGQEVTVCSVEGPLGPMGVLDTFTLSGIDWADYDFTIDLTGFYDAMVDNYFWVQFVGRADDPEIGDFDVAKISIDGWSPLHPDGEVEEVTPDEYMTFMYGVDEGGGGSPTTSRYGQHPIEATFDDDDETFLDSTVAVGDTDFYQIFDGDGWLAIQVTPLFVGDDGGFDLTGETVHVTLRIKGTSSSTIDIGAFQGPWQLDVDGDPVDYGTINLSADDSIFHEYEVSWVPVKVNQDPDEPLTTLLFGLRCPDGVFSLSKIEVATGSQWDPLVTEPDT